MHRCFVNPEDVVGVSARIAGSEAHHIYSVLRMREGSEIMVCEGDGYEYLAVISSAKPEEIIAEIIKVRKSFSEPPIEVVLAQAIIKKRDSFELVIQKATEIGVSSFVPLQSERTVVEIDKQKMAKRQERWGRIALEASKQSGRACIPEVGLPASMDEFLNSIPRDILCLIPWECEEAVGIKEILDKERRNMLRRTVAIIVGPEGGFTETEVDAARRAGALPVSLGPRILKAETAGITALAVVMYELGDLGGAAGG